MRALILLGLATAVPCSGQSVRDVPWMTGARLLEMVSYPPETKSGLELSRSQYATAERARLYIDLQKLVHGDMRANWNAYPHPAKWNLKRPDTHIDHRRVPNLATFFRRHGTTMPPASDARGFLPGDLVAWELPYGLPHIGIVADRTSTAGTPLVIHNIGSGTKMEDVLFAFKITGHYRYMPTTSAGGTLVQRMPPML